MAVPVFAVQTLIWNPPYNNGCKTVDISALRSMRKKNHKRPCVLTDTGNAPELECSHATIKW